MKTTRAALPLASFALFAAIFGASCAAQTASGPIEITHGGTYSGHWTSNDPKVPAVAVRTDEPVVLRDSTVSGRGNLIYITGVKSGANVTVENVTGTALDPGVAGASRGTFVLAADFNALTVTHCTITGTMFGIKATAANPKVLRITNNLGRNLEDRASDGHGGLQPKRPGLGHFVILAGLTATNGAEIAWNKVVQTIGGSSTEDVINLYNSQGSASHPLWVHDNYMEGESSPSNALNYTGTGIITDGATANGKQPTAYVLFENNQVVATPGTGVAIAAGHDIQGRNNRVVSCGVTSSGVWYAFGRPAIYIWNYYGGSSFYNNSITTTAGGMVGPSATGTGKAYDVWVNPNDANDPGISASNNNFTDPCLVNGKVNLHAEDEERARWKAKLEKARETVGAGQAR